jgi:CubicO group peptidase (beta-lactamase class C family)
MKTGRLEKLIARFRRQHTAGAFPGGQLALCYQGKVIHNQVLGIGRGFRANDLQEIVVVPETPFPVFSAGKPLAALAIALLEDRGNLDIMAPISNMIPEFVGGGKEHITTLDVLTHRSGLMMPKLAGAMHLWANREAVLRAIGETMPTFPRGTLAYHPHEYGWILSEIVWRLTDRSLADFCAQEIADPLELPSLRYGLAGRSIESIAYSYWLGKDNAMVAGVNVAENFELQNSQQFFEAENPATSMVTDAASLASFYQFILQDGITISGKRLISKETLSKYTTLQHRGWDRTIKTISSVGRGFFVGSRFPSSFGWWNTGSCFGHAGAFSSLAFGDYKTGISAAILTNGNRSLQDFARRFIPLAQDIRNALQ